MDQSYFRFLFRFRLARKSKQSGLAKSEKRLAKRNVTCDWSLTADITEIFLGSVSKTVFFGGWKDNMQAEIWEYYIRMSQDIIRRAYMKW